MTWSYVSKRKETSILLQITGRSSLDEEVNCLNKYFLLLISELFMFTFQVLFLKLTEVPGEKIAFPPSTLQLNINKVITYERDQSRSINKMQVNNASIFQVKCSSEEITLFSINTVFKNIKTIY